MTLYEPFFLTPNFSVIYFNYLSCADSWLQIFVMPVTSAILDGFRTMRKSVSKVSRRYFFQCTTLVEICRDPELAPDGTRDIEMYVASSQDKC